MSLKISKLFWDWYGKYLRYLIKWIIIHSASANTSADMPEGRFIKLKILLKHSGML